MKDLGFTGSIVVLVAIALASLALRLTDSGDSHAENTPPATSTVAQATPSPTPEPAPTPTYAEILADAVRVLDLAAWGDALEVHHTRSGAYPLTGRDFEMICGKPSDAICALRSIDPELHLTDGEQPYWYRSDGRTFTLVASLSIEPADDTCPDDLPADLSAGPVACVTPEGAP